MRFWNLSLHIAVYALYGLVAFVIFLYLTFPYDVLRQRLEEWGSQDGIQLTLTRLQPAFPPGLRGRGLRVVAEQWSTSDAALQVETWSAQPEWLALLSGHLQVRFEGSFYGGRLDGEARQTKGEGGTAWDIKAHFADVDVTQHALVRKDNKPFLRGRLSGDMTGRVSADGQLQESALNLRGQPLSLAALPGGVMQLQREIACDTSQAELKTAPTQAGNLVFTCQGKDLTLEARGTIGWRVPLNESQVNVRWQVRSEEAYKQEMELLATFVRKRPDRRGELSFRLQGPLRQLRVGA